MGVMRTHRTEQAMGVIRTHRTEQAMGVTITHRTEETTAELQTATKWSHFATNFRDSASIFYKHSRMCDLQTWNLLGVHNVSTR